MKYRYSEERFLSRALRGRHTVADSADPRFTAIVGADPVETEVARFLYAFVRLRKAHAVVETGTNIGISSLSIAAALEDDDLRGSKLYTYDVENHGVQKAANALCLGDRLRFHHTSSLSAALAEELDKIDILFLDSLPSLLAAELEYFFPLLRRESVIVIHDARLFAEKRKAIENFKHNRKWSELLVPAGRGVSLLTADGGAVLALPQSVTVSVVQDTEIGATDHDSVVVATRSAPIRQAMGGDQAACRQVIAEVASALNDRASHVAIATTPQALAEVRIFAELCSSNPEPCDVYCGKNGSPIAFYQGRQEFEHLAPKFHDPALPDPRHIQVPLLSDGLFIASRKLTKAVGGLESLNDNLSWSIACLATRLMLVNAVMQPKRKCPDVTDESHAGNPRASVAELTIARRFYASLGTGLRNEPTRYWRRFSRQYLYGMPALEVSIPAMLAAPGKWLTLMRCFFGV
jgi:predicted O-methyltransferase YrrM